MAPRRAITVVPSRAAIQSDRAPLTDRFYLPLDYPGIYRFAEGDDSEDDGVTTLVSSGGPVGAHLLLAIDDVGDDLGDANITIQLGDGLCRFIPAATLTGNITITLGTTNARAGYPIEIVRLDAGAFTVAIVNGGAAGGTLCTMPVSQRARFRGHFKDDNWRHRCSHLML